MPKIIGITKNDMVPAVLQAIDKNGFPVIKTAIAIFIILHAACRAMKRVLGMQAICFMLFQLLIKIGGLLRLLIMKFQISLQNPLLLLQKRKSQLQ